MESQKRKRRPKMLDSGSEGDRGRQLKKQMSKDDRLWLFFDTKSRLLHSLMRTSEKWPDGFTVSDMNEIPPGSTLTLRIHGNYTECVLLSTGGKKEVAENEMRAFDILEDHGDVVEAFFGEVSTGMSERGEIQTADVSPSDMQQTSRPDIDTPKNFSDVPQSLAPSAAKANFEGSSVMCNGNDFDAFLSEHKARIRKTVKAYNKLTERQECSFLHHRKKTEDSINDLNEQLIVQKCGFQSVDQYSGLDKCSPVVINGVNVMEVERAGDNPTLFGRQIRERIFGTAGLTDTMISPSKNAKREAVDSSLKSKFKRIVKMKYPRTPNRAYLLAKRGANQAGLDFARDHLRKNEQTIPELQ